MRTPLLSQKTMIKLPVILFILVFSSLSYGQDLPKYCGQEYGGDLLSKSKSITDSLLRTGIDTLIGYNHYSQGFGYSKIIWTDRGAVFEYRLDEQKKTSTITVVKNQIGPTHANDVLRLLKMIDLQESPTELKDCHGFISHQPYHVLYFNLRGLESCQSVAENQVDCNTRYKKIELVKLLRISQEEYSKILGIEAPVEKKIKN